MSSGFDKIIAILKKTGDNCIIVDESGNPEYMVMPFERYEKLIDGVSASTQPESDWKSVETENRLDDWEDLANLPIGEPKNEEKQVDKAKNTPTPAQGDKQYFFEPID